MTNTFSSADDALRVGALRQLAILDTPQEHRFDRLTRLASATFGVPIALVSLIDSDRQWFKSRIGVDALETPRSVAFCSHTVALRDMLVVPDATLDARFADNPLVLGEPCIRFYAGQPLFSPDGHALGTLCIIDRVAREFAPGQRLLLRDLAQLAEDEINKDANVAARRAAEQRLQQLNVDLERRIEQRTSALRDNNDALKREIDQRETAEATLRASEARIRTIIGSSFSAFVSMDQDGRIVDWNASAERTFGWTMSEVIGQDLAQTIIPERMRSAHRVGLARFLDTGDGPAMNRRIEMPALTRAGREITVEMTISAFPSPDGLFFGAFLHDISERLEASRVLEQKQELLDAIMDSVDVGLISCGANGQLTMFNRAAREFHGQPPEGLDPAGWVGHYRLFDADGTTPLTQENIPLLRALGGETVKDVALVIAPPDLPRRALLASGRPLLSATGEALGAIVALKDVTELEASRAQLALNEQRLRALTENLPTLIGQIDQTGAFTFLNAQAARFFGKPAFELIGKPMRSVYTAHEFAKVEPHMRSALAGKRVAFEDDVTVHGQRFYYHASYIPDIDADGQLNGFYAMAFDITARRLSEIRQRDSEERLRTITDNLPVLISYIDRELKYRFANALYKEWYGVAPELMLGRTVQDIFGSAFTDARIEHLRKCLAGETVQLDFEVNSGAAPRIVHSVFIPHVRNGEVLGAYVLSSDVTAARQQEQQLKAQALTDSLTGLANRRSYEAQLDMAIKRARRSGVPLALMFLDIDHFKQINDTLGHAGGDEVLNEFARRLGASVRATDTVCRLAGDEFTIILEGVASVRECDTIGQKILAAIRVPFTVGAQVWPVSTSIGVAWSCADTITAQRLSEQADAALYQAKAAGRDGVLTVEMS